MSKPVWGIVETEFEHHLGIRLQALGKEIMVPSDSVETVGGELCLRPDAKIERVFNIAPARESQKILVPDEVLAQLRT